MLARMAYRVQQFWSNMTAAPAEDELEQARFLLGPDLFLLFSTMPPAEQTHALRVFMRLTTAGEQQPELLCAALLHDVGKTRQPLRLWERVVIVLAQVFLPAQAADWGTGQPAGWRRPFVVAAQHPQWGADMAAQAGADPLVVKLIHRHQEAPLSPAATVEDRLLQRLQAADNLS